MPVELNKADRIKTLCDRLLNQLVLNACAVSGEQMDKYVEASLLSETNEIIPPMPAGAVGVSRP